MICKGRSAAAHRQAADASAPGSATTGGLPEGLVALCATTFLKLCAALQLSSANYRRRRSSSADQGPWQWCVLVVAQADLCRLAACRGA